MNRARFVLIFLLFALINLSAWPAFISSAASVVDYSTLFGGSNFEQGTGTAVDAQGNLVVVGYSGSDDLPVTPGAVQIGGGGFSDLFVMKLDREGHLIFAARLGGSSFDEALAVALDPSGDIYVTGRTLSADFPTTPGAFRGGVDSNPLASYTVFVAKLSAAGDRLLYSTYIGGGEGHAIAVDQAGNAYLTGATGVGIYPTTTGAIGPTGGGEDVFVTKLNPSGSALVYSALLGGRRPDQGRGLSLDSAGNVYVAGRSESLDFPTTAGAFQRTYASPTAAGQAPGSEGDAFVAKLNLTSGALIYSTFVGGNDEDEALGLAVDASGAAYLTGDTSSTNFPVTATAFQRRGSAAGDTFVAKLNPTGSALSYATLLGGNLYDVGRSIAVDAAGNATVTGYTYSSDFPVVSPLQRTNLSGPVFKSTDAGATWNAVNTGMGPASIIYTLAIDARDSMTLYAGGDGGFKSTNGGADWQRLAYPVPFDTSITRTLASEATDSAVLYAVTHQGRVARSQDGGATWRDLGFVASQYALALDPTNATTLYAATDKAFQGTGVSRSTDGGATWRFTLLSSFQRPVTVVAIDPQRPATLYAGLNYNGGLMKSTDSGATWAGIALQNVSVISLAIVPSDSTTLYAGTDLKGLYKSTDGGNSWAGPLLDVHTAVNTIAIDRASPLLIYAGTDEGLFKSTDGGSSWTRTTLSSLGVHALAIDPERPATLYAGTNYGSDIFVTKLNADGSALFYSTYVGGGASDEANAVAVDAVGNTYVTGIARSANFPSVNAVSTNLNGVTDAFAFKLSSLPTRAAPTILAVTTSGKHLVVTGENFSDGAVLLVDGEAQRTLQDEQTAHTTLTGKKTAKRIAHGQTVTVQVRNTDGALSEPVPFMRD